MPEVKRSSDIVENHAEQAMFAGIVGVACCGAAFPLWNIGGGMRPLAGVLAAIGLLSLGYMTFRLIKLKSVKAFTLVCPFCRAKNGFLEEPMSDVACRECHRMIPIENGRLMPIAEIRCLNCGETAYYSGRTKALVCEGCGKEIAIAPEAIAALQVPR